MLKNKLKVAGNKIKRAVRDAKSAIGATVDVIGYNISNSPRTFKKGIAGAGIVLSASSCGPKPPIIPPTTEHYNKTLNFYAPNDYSGIEPGTILDLTTDENLDTLFLKNVSNASCRDHDMDADVNNIFRPAYSYADAAGKVVRVIGNEFQQVNKISPTNLDFMTNTLGAKVEYIQTQDVYFDYNIEIKSECDNFVEMPELYWYTNLTNEKIMDLKNLPTTGRIIPRVYCKKARGPPPEMLTILNERFTELKEHLTFMPDTLYMTEVSTADSIRAHDEFKLVVYSLRGAPYPEHLK